MKIHFYKYQATGNDFVLLDNRSGQYSFTLQQIQNICHRRLGIGADGLMLIEKHPSFDFNLVYYNSDGSQSLCGNGSRAAVRLAASLGMLSGKAKFNAYDGIHLAEVVDRDIIKLKMNDVKKAERHGEDYFLNTGSPHFVRFVAGIHEYPVLEEGKKIRYSTPFQPGGTNVNFAELRAGNTIFVRTYERGVENETLSCGTGVVAAALASSFKGYASPVTIQTLGGQLSVDYETATSEGSHEGIFTGIFLTGPAKLVFEGDLEL